MLDMRYEKTPLNEERKLGVIEQDLRVILYLFWQKMEEKKMEHIILFDGVCNLCNAAVRIIINYDRKSIFRFASLQSETAKKIISANALTNSVPETIIYFENGKPYYKSTAALKIAKRLKFPFFLLYIFIVIPTPLRDLIYEIIAKYRYRWFGKKEECMIPGEGLKEKFIG